MHKVLVVLLALLVSPVTAQNIIGSGVTGDLKVSGGGAFAGSGDAVSGAKAWYSCARAYTAAYATATGNLCDLVDTSTGAATCTLKSGTNGFADLTGTYCTGAVTVVNFCTVAHTGCSVKKAYDQTGALACSGAGNCDISEATLANMPLLSLSSINSLPCMTFALGQDLTSTLTLTQAQPFSYSVVSKRTGNFTTFSDIIGDSSRSGEATYGGSADQIGIFAGSAAIVTATDSVFHGVQFVVNNTSSAVAVGTTQTSGLTAGTQTLSNDIAIAITHLIGVVCEAGMWPVAFSGAQQTSLFNNQNSSSGYNGGL